MDLPPEIPGYCFNCGESFEIVELTHEGDEARGVLQCQNCGAISAFARVEDSAVPLETTFALKEDRSVQIIPQEPEGREIGPPFAPDEAAMAASEAWQPNIEGEGLSSVLALAAFPVFGLAIKSLPLHESGNQLQSSIEPDSGRPLIQSLTLLYSGPIYEAPTSVLSVRSEAAENPDRDGITEALNAVDQLASIYHELWFSLRRETPSDVHRFINAQAFQTASRSGRQIKLGSGQGINWQVRKLNGPVAVASAIGTIRATHVSIAVVGSLPSTDLEKALSSVKEIAPDSTEAANWDAGYQRYFHHVISRARPGDSD